MEHLDEAEAGVRSDVQPSSDAGEVVVRTTPARRVGLSREECWQLYGWLGERAPFVRHRLRVIRSGGTGDVSLITPQERCEVLEAIDIGGRSLSFLTSGLLSLKLALTGDNRSAAPEPPRTPSSERAL